MNSKHIKRCPTLLVILEIQIKTTKDVTLYSFSQACNPSTLGSQGRWITRSRDQDHPGQHGETLSLLKTQKLAGHGGA